MWMARGGHDVIGVMCMEGGGGDVDGQEVGGM